MSAGNNDLIKDRFSINFILSSINFISNSDEITIEYISCIQQNITEVREIESLN